jgi:hypothetical protein
MLKLLMLVPLGFVESRRSKHDISTATRLAMPDQVLCGPLPRDLTGGRR